MMRNRTNSSRLVNKDYLKKLTIPIPHDEAVRIRLLNETRVINTSQTDAVYDRFTTLAKRIFEVPMSAITFVTEDMIWLKSASGMDITDTHRNHSFCTYAILPESPQLFIVLDALKDKRFSDNLLVTGPPFIRFFASVPLSIDSVKLGTLCILDTIPHDDFDTESSLNLLDLGEAVSNLIRQRRQSILRIKREERLIEIAQQKIMTDVMHNVRTPLMSIGIAISLLESDLKNTTSTVDSVGTNNTQTTIAELKRAVNNLEEVVESKLQNDHLFPVFPLDHLHDEIQEYKENENKITGVNLLELLHHVRFPTLSPYHSDTNYLTHVNWSIDETFFVLGTSYTYPYIIRNILIRLLKDLAFLWNRINVIVRFRNDTISNNGSQKSDVLEDLDIDTDIISGYVNIQLRVFQLSTKTDERKNDDTTVYMNSICPMSNIKIRIDDTIQEVEFQLYELQGNCKVIDFRESTDQSSADERLYDFKIPCSIQKNESTNAISSTDNMQPYSPSSVTTTSAELENIRRDRYDVTTTTIQGKICEGNEVESLLLTSSSGSIVSPFEPQTPSRDLQILIVEDSIPIQKMMTRWLECNGCKVTIADNGENGLTLLQTQKFDLTFMDFLMPVMLGRDAMCSYQKWRNSSRTNDINKNMLLVGMSANANEDDLRECFKYGMHAFANKPIDTKVFTEIVHARRYHRNVTAMLQELKTVTALRNCLNEHHITAGTATTRTATSITTSTKNVGIITIPESKHETKISSAVIGSGGCTCNLSLSLMRVMSTEVDSDKCPYCGELKSTQLYYSNLNEERFLKLEGDVTKNDSYSRTSFHSNQNNKYYIGKNENNSQDHHSESEELSTTTTVVEVGHKLSRHSLVVLNPFAHSRDVVGVDSENNVLGNSDTNCSEPNGSQYHHNQYQNSQQQQLQHQQQLRRISSIRQQSSSCFSSFFRNLRVNTTLFDGRCNKSSKVHV